MLLSPRTRRAGSTNADVVDLLVDQHREIRRGFARVARGGPERGRDWRQLRRLLAVHEAAEEAHVHPVARKAIPGGRRVIAQRLAEEKAAKRLLRQLDRVGPASPKFDPLFGTFRTAVLGHARREEREEFRALRHVVSAPRRRSLTLEAKLTQAMAPTRPHPRVNSQLANKLASPVAGPLDRMRDVVSRVLGR